MELFGTIQQKCTSRTSKMKKTSKECEQLFYAVQFIRVPFKGIDDYVCVPHSWIILRRATNQKVLVAYPKDEDPFDTRERAQRREKYGDDWQFYLAIIKYESYTYRDADFWIATKNDYGPFAEENSKITDTQPKSTLDRKLRSATLSNSSRSKKSETQLTMKTNDNPRKPMIKISIKRPNQSGPKDQPDKKRLKLDEAAKSTSGVVNYATVEPGCSKREQSIIIRDDQSIESIQTEERAAAFNSTTITERSIQSQCTKKGPSIIREFISSLTREAREQEPNVSIMEVNESINIIDSDNEVQLNNIVEQRPFSSQIRPQFAKQRESVIEQQVSVTPSIEMTCDYRKPCIDNKTDNIPSTSNHLPNSLKLSAQLQRYMSDKPSLIPNHNPVYKKIQQSSPAQEHLMRTARMQDRPSGSSTTDRGIGFEHLLINEVFTAQHRSNPATSQPNENLPCSRENQYFPVHQHNSQQERQRQELLQRSTESNYADHIPNYRTVTIRVPCDGQNSSNLSNQFYQNIDPPQQRQLQPNYQNLPRDPRVPRIHVGISIRSKNNNQMVGFHGPTKRMPPSVQPEFSNSMRHAFVPGHTNYTLNDQRTQTSISETLPAIRKVVDSACQTDGSITDQTLSPYYEVASDNEAVSDHDMSINETPVQITNDVDSIQIASESNSADRPIAPQHPTTTSLQQHPRIILEQQMLNNFATLFTQMGTTLAYTTDMFDNLRSSIRESADTYKKLLDAVENFNTLGNSATTPSSSSNVTSDVPQVIVEERRTEVSEGETSGYGSQCDNNVVKKPPKGKCIIRWTFALPSEYDPNDTRWTLKYRENEPGLVELMPESYIYVSYGELKYCTEVSTNCKSLAKLLLVEIFSKNALSVCESLTERAKPSNKEGSKRRPELDTNACIFMLKFIQEHAFKRGWDTPDTKNVLKGIHGKMLDMRFKYGRMVRC